MITIWQAISRPRKSSVQLGKDKKAINYRVKSQTRVVI